MLNFDTRTGPDLGADTPSYPDRGVPEWYRDAKLGFFIHWGLYSVPAWGTPPGATPVPTEDAYAYHQYAEWYGNTVRIPHSPTRKRHEEIFGVGTSYEDLADHWDVGDFDAQALVAAIVDAGARYVIPTTKHHEGFCLWDTATTGFNAARRGPRRDLIAEIAAATRTAGARFGVYYSGALDWHVSDFPPIESDTDLFRYRRNDANFARYSAAQLEELVERFAPDVLWNDIDWPDAGKGGESFGVAALLDRYFAGNPDGVVNDRWGVPYHGYLTREYTDLAEISPVPWESTRGLGYSFGFNQDESEEHSLSGAALIRHLVDVVSKNGNLLINVGPRADGSIPELQARAMAEMGAWLRVNGEAIFATRPWLRANESGVSFTRTADAVYLLVTDPEIGELTLPAELAGAATVTWLGGSEAAVHGGVAAIPEALRAQSVAVARVAV